MTSRIVIAGTHSGVGKTTIALGLIVALRRRGLVVQPYKVGPDYIDPTHHARAAGRPCRNLDTWLMSPGGMRDLFARTAADADIAVLEGVMGLHDGIGYESDRGSTAEIAKLLSTPVLLVIDAAGAARSVSAMALGYRDLDPAVRLAGVLVNRIAGEAHATGVATAIRTATGLPVLGTLPRDSAIAIDERHLGLVPAVVSPTRRRGSGDVTPRDGSAPPSADPESSTDGYGPSESVRSRRGLADGGALLSRGMTSPLPRLRVGLTTADDIRAEAAGDWIEKHVDLDHLLEIATAAPPIDFAPTPRVIAHSRPAPVIAVAQDEAFCFTYPENIETLVAAGATIVPFSPLHDAELPANTSGILLSGGFPEVHAATLAANHAMRTALRQAIAGGVPVYAECGGLMALTEAIVDRMGREFPMLGVLPGRAVMAERVTLGYRRAESIAENWLVPKGTVVPGHEFHYSRWHDRPATLPAAYRLTSASRPGDAWLEGACVGNVVASYVHLHFGGTPELAERFVAACRTFAGAGSPS
jgi:cobyrinic acid a,c-diamide synthase